MERLYSPLEIAEMLQVHRRTVYAWVSSGKLKSFKVGGYAVRVKQGDLDAFLRPRKPSKSIR